VSAWLCLSAWWSLQWLYFGSERIITVIRLLVIQVRTHNWLERHKCTLFSETHCTSVEVALFLFKMNR